MPVERLPVERLRVERLPVERLPVERLPVERLHVERLPYILDPHMAPYGACKSYKAKFEEGVVFLCFCCFVCLCFCVIVFLCVCVFVLLSKRCLAAAKWHSREAVFEQTLPGCSEMAFQRGCV